MIQLPFPPPGPVELPGPVAGEFKVKRVSSLWRNANQRYFSLTIPHNRRNSMIVHGGLKLHGERGVLVIETKASRG
jgi:hypothetical protein